MPRLWSPPPEQPSAPVIGTQTIDRDIQDKQDIRETAEDYPVHLVYPCLILLVFDLCNVNRSINANTSGLVDSFASLWFQQTSSFNLPALKRLRRSTLSPSASID